MLYLYRMYQKKTDNLNLALFQLALSFLPTPLVHLLVPLKQFSIMILVCPRDVRDEYLDFLQLTTRPSASDVPQEGARAKSVLFFFSGT